MNLILRILKRVLWNLCWVFPVKKDKIVFSSFCGRPYADNPKYIAREILNQNLNYDLVWLVNDTDLSDVPSQIRCVKIRSFKSIYELITAKVWIDNTRKEYFKKKKNQFYIQTWHGGFGLKKIEKDAIDKLPDYYIRQAIRDSQFCNLMISNSRTLTKLYQDSFWYDGNVIEYGLPRNDILVNTPPDLKDFVKSKLKLDKKIKILLYAPTFRKNHDFSVYNLNYKMVSEGLSKKFGGEWLILTKFHPNVIKEAKTLDLNSPFVCNVSSYNDIQELYVISDVCITDYSSVMFDFMITKKPCFLYASDIEEYRKERDFFININDLPFSISQSNQELIKAIDTFNINDYCLYVKRFSEKMGILESGSASKEIVKIIKEKIGENK